MRDSEERLDAVTGLVLLVGAGLGLVAMAIGAGLLLAGYPADATGPKPPQVVFPGAMVLDPVYLIGMGILLLVATQVIRVAVLAIGFALLRRFRFALVSVLVLSLLFVSFLVASAP